MCCLRLAWHDGWVVVGMNEEYSHHVFDVMCFYPYLLGGFHQCVTFEIVSYYRFFGFLFTHKYYNTVLFATNITLSFLFLFLFLYLSPFFKIWLKPPYQYQVHPHYLPSLRDSFLRSNQYCASNQNHRIDFSILPTNSIQFFNSLLIFKTVHRRTIPMPIHTHHTNTFHTFQPKHTQIKSKWLSNSQKNRSLNSKRHSPFSIRMEMVSDGIQWRIDLT